MSIKEDSIIGSILSVLKRKPEMLALLLIVGAFLFFMDHVIEKAEAAFYGSDYWLANVDYVRSHLAHRDIVQIETT